MRGEPRHHGEVLTDPAGHGGPLDLYHHLRPVEQLRTVDLGDGSRRQGLGIDGGEHLAGIAAELLRDHLLDHGPGLGRYLIATPLELRHELRGEDPIARGHNLSELDVRRPQPLCCDPQATGDSGDLLRTPAPPFRDVPQAERAAEMADGGPHSGPRGQSPRRDQIRERGAVVRLRTARSPDCQAISPGTRTHGPFSEKTPHSVSADPMIQSVLTRSRASCRAHQASLKGQHDRLHPIPQSELGQNAPDVGLDGRLRNEEPFGDFDVGKALGHRNEHLGLASGERAQDRGYGALFLRSRREIR